MKKTLIILAAIALFASCTKDEFKGASNDKNLVEMTFTASAEGLTKTVLNADRSVSFNAGDAISIFANGTNYKFTTAEGGANAVFTGTAEVASTYYALCPYQEAATIEGGVIKNVTVNKGSTPCNKGSFDPEKEISVAVTTGGSLNFKTICALLKFTVPEDITDFQQLVVFTRNNEPITGIVSVTPSATGDPSFTVTTTYTQTGAYYKDGFKPGTYYIPILPFAANKGYDVSMTFCDSYNTRGWNGNPMNIERGKVYNIGTIAKTDTFTYDTFDVTTTIQTYAGTVEYSGNSGAVAIGNNPFKTTSNNSAKVLKDDMSASTSATSGMVNMNLAAVKFPTSVRDKFTKVRMKIYLGANEYYPRILFNKSGTAYLPTTINGEGFTTEQDWKNIIRTDDWNEFEWTAATFGKTNLQTLTGLQIRLFVDFSNTNKSGFDATKNNRKVYIDDIQFVR